MSLPRGKRRTSEVRARRAGTSVQRAEEELLPLNVMEEQYAAARGALLANQRLQARLKEVVQTVEEGMCKNAEAQATILVTARQHKTVSNGVDQSASARRAAKPIGPSRFWMACGKVPELTEDAQSVLEAFQYLPHTFVQRRWTPEEDDNLELAVLRHFQEAKHTRILAEAVESGALPSGQELTDQATRVGKLTLASPGVEQEIMDTFEEQQIWSLVATQLANRRSAGDCMSRWLNYLRPSLKSHSSGQLVPWTKSEEKQLRTLAESYEERSWPKIAEELDTGRSPAACLARYRQLEQQKLPKPWSQEEIARLRLSFAQHAGKGSFWKAIASEFPGRTSEQVMHFHRNHLTEKRKGKWSPEEDEDLRRAVKVLGRKWSKVATAVPSRTQVQCRERYVNVLAPELNRDAWTEAEDAVILKGVQECRHADGTVRWCGVASRIPGRTDDAVKNRFAAIGKATHSLQRNAVKPSTLLASNEPTRKPTRKREGSAAGDEAGSNAGSTRKSQRRKTKSRRQSEAEEAED